MLSGMKLRHDSHGYYAVYNYYGSVERYLGRSGQELSFSDFAKKMGGKTSKKIRTFKVTKAGRELKKLGAGALIAYITTIAGCPWYASYAIGVVGDKSVDALIREPGKYRITYIMCSIPVEDSFSYVNEVYNYSSFSSLEKYDSKSKTWKKFGNYVDQYSWYSICLMVTVQPSGQIV